MPFVFWLPLAFASLHIVEEFVFPGGFLAWYRAYRPDRAASITPRFVIVANGVLLAAAAAAGFLSNQWQGPQLWLIVSSALAGNALFHVRGSIITKTYSPGMITGVLLLLPLFAAFLLLDIRRHILSPHATIYCLLVGFSYQWVSALLHGGRPKTMRLRRDGEISAATGDLERIDGPVVDRPLTARSRS